MTAQPQNGLERFAQIASSLGCLLTLLVWVVIPAIVVIVWIILA